MKKAVIAVVLSVLVVLLSANLNTLAHAQGALVAPSNVAAQNTGNPGEVRITWDAVPDAAYYRIGWVAYSDVEPIITSGGDWLERFAFIDIQNRSQTQHTIARLTPGVQYAFIVASNDGRYGTPQWPSASGWQYLTLTEATVSHAGIGTTSVNVTWDAVPGAAYYRIGWVVYSDVEPIIASGGDWLEHFAFIDIANQGQTEHTIGRLTPGLLYAFIVAGNDGRYGTPQWPDASGWQFMTPGAEEPDTQAPDTGPSQADQPPCPPSDWTVAPRPRSAVPGDYDADDDGLIEVANLAQLDAMRYDRGGSGSPYDQNLASYFGAFPNAAAGMGCPEEGCTGYELVADLDFDTNGNGQADVGDRHWNDGAGWLPIIHYGDFDGGNHSIANLYINRGQDTGVGMFANSGDRVRGLALSSVNVTGGALVGGLSGGGGAIVDSCVSGMVSGNENVGGLAGSAGYIIDSYATGTVTGTGENIGGLAGSVALIKGSYTTNTVTGIGGHSRSGVYMGGLAGSVTRRGSISDSYATGAVSGQTYVGGLVGLAGEYVSISDSYAAGTVTSNHVNAGGLIGSTRDSVSISDSYNTGAVSGGGNVGGLVGSGSGSISDSYNTGAVSGGHAVGGLMGIGSASISDSYATGTVSGKHFVGGLVGSGGAAFGRAFIRNSYATGAVIGESNTVGGLVGSSSFAINNSYATGTVSSGSGNVGGLVGRSIGSITGSYATGAISGGGDSVGGLVGNDSGRITGSYAIGAVSGKNAIGGLVGTGLAPIRGSYATGAVSGEANVGGLVGSSTGSISGSYAKGVVSGTFRVGGLIGQARGDTSYSYAAGRVSGSGVVGGLIGDSTGTVTHSYWDTVTSGQSHSDGGTGKNTSELQSPTGYTGIYANWNMDVDGDTHPDDPWDFGTSGQYPALKYGVLNPSQQR